MSTPIDLWNWSPNAEPAEAPPEKRPAWKGIDMSTMKDLVPERNAEVAAHRLASRALAAMGWDLRAVDIDENLGRARIDVERDNRTVIFFVDRLGRASFERFVGRTYTEALGRRGNRYLSDVRKLEFIGRESFKDPREGLREFVAYLAHNGSEHAEALESAVTRLLLPTHK
jgi:hypothetical protein